MSYGLEYGDGGVVFNHSHGAGTSSLPYQKQVENKRQNMWNGYCISFWWP